jgi:F0F1-type ATP synthase delta subunit
VNEIFDLSDFFVTKSQAADFVRGISSIIDKMYEVNFNLEDAFAQEFGIDKRDKFIELLHENSHRNLSLKDYLISFIEEVKILPEIEISIAYEPNNETLKAISQWFIITYNKQVLINLRVDRSLVAGAALNYKGKYKDFSYRAQFLEILNKHIATMKNPNQKNQTIHQQTEFITVGR